MQVTQNYSYCIKELGYPDMPEATAQLVDRFERILKPVLEELKSQGISLVKEQVRRKFDICFVIQEPMGAGRSMTSDFLEMAKQAKQIAEHVICIQLLLKPLGTLNGTSYFENDWEKRSIRESGFFEDQGLEAGCFVQIAQARAAAPYSPFDFFAWLNPKTRSTTIDKVAEAFRTRSFAAIAQPSTPASPITPTTAEEPVAVEEPKAAAVKNPTDARQPQPKSNYWKTVAVGIVIIAALSFAAIACRRIFNPLRIAV